METRDERRRREFGSRTYIEAQMCSDFRRQPPDISGASSGGCCNAPSRNSRLDFDDAGELNRSAEMCCDRCLPRFLSRKLEKAGAAPLHCVIRTSPSRRGNRCTLSVTGPHTGQNKLLRQNLHFKVHLKCRSWKPGSVTTPVFVLERRELMFAEVQGRAKCDGFINDIQQECTRSLK